MRSFIAAALLIAGFCSQGCAQPVSVIQSVGASTSIQVSATSTSWALTNLAVTITPTDPSHVVELRFVGAVQQATHGIIGKIAILKGGAQIGTENAVYSSGADAFVVPVSGIVADAPGTTGPVTYTIAVKNAPAGGTMWFPGYGPNAVASIRATEYSGSSYAADPVNQLALTDGVVDQQGTDLGAAFFKTETGLTAKSSTISTKTLVLIAAGQSIGANSAPTPFMPVNSTVDMLNPYDGLVWGAKDPLLGATGSGGNYTTRLADKLVTDGKFARVIIVSITSGGTSAFDWSTNGVQNQRLRVACNLIKSLGWIGNANASFGIIYDQGQQDASIATAAATWENEFANIKASIEGLGCSIPWFVPTDTMLTNVTNATIQGAQAAVVASSVYAGPNTDGLTGANRQADGTHLSDLGAAANAGLWASVIEAHY